MSNDLFVEKKFMGRETIYIFHKQQPPWNNRNKKFSIFVLSGSGNEMNMQKFMFFEWFQPAKTFLLRIDCVLCSLFSHRTKICYNRNLKSVSENKDH